MNAITLKIVVVAFPTVVTASMIFVEFSNNLHTASHNKILNSKSLEVADVEPLPIVPIIPNTLIKETMLTSNKETRITMLILTIKGIRMIYLIY